MNRYVASAAVCSLFLACAPARPATTETASAVVELPLERATPRTPELAESDRYEEVLPRGTFASVEALCDRQRDLIVPKLEEANGMRDGEDLLVPSCAENLAVLDDVPVALAAPFRDVKAIQAEIGTGTAAFLVVRTEAGWSAVREAFVTIEHDDPGCPSIERDNGIVELRVDRGALVVVTTSDQAGEDGPILLTRQRACRIGRGTPTCAPPETIETKFL